MAKPRPYRERKWLVFHGRRENAIDRSFIVVGRCVKNCFELGAVWAPARFRIDNETARRTSFCSMAIFGARFGLQLDWSRRGWNDSGWRHVRATRFPFTGSESGICILHGCGVRSWHSTNSNLGPMGGWPLKMPGAVSHGSLTRTSGCPWL
jgi:hypothetical protein